MNKKVATEIIKAGYRQLCKTYHPDMGGTHNAMIELTATYEGLLKTVDGGGGPRMGSAESASDRARKERQEYGKHYQREHWSDDFREKAKGANAGKGPELERFGRNHVLIRNVHCVGASPKAIQVMFPGDPTPAWLPRSQLHSACKILKEGDRGDLIITDWIASQKGWSVR